MLKMTKVEIPLIHDYDMLLTIQKGIRGGISMASNRYAKANNKYMEDLYDKNKESTFISYMDKTNLYGWAMSQKLPSTIPVWMSESELENWKSMPCILEADLEYPNELHDIHNDYPLAPEHVTVKKIDKLIPNLNDKKKYIIHHENLKLYVSLGLKITKIYRGIKFEESDWLKQYIDFNTSMRAKAKNDF